jgi:type IX secretion system PorP/SprF family membrane protein
MKTTIIICAFILSSMVRAQQDASFSMYFFNPMYINPGYAGSRETFSGTIVNRNQWANMPDAPASQSINIHSAIPFTNVGLGLQVYNDRTGPMRNTGINLTYAYHIPVTKKAKLSLGVTGMLNNLNIKWDRIHVEDPNDLSFTDNPVQLYGFLKKHATKKQLTELNKNTNFLIEELEWQLKDLEGNMFVV